MYYMLPMEGGLGLATEPPEENAAIPADMDPEDFIPGSADEAAEEVAVVREEVTADRWMVPASLATQIFSVVPGIAGGLAGFVLASKLANAKAVKASEVMMAAGTVAMVSFLAVFIVRTVDEFE